MSLRIKYASAIVSLLLATGAVHAAFEFDITCKTCPPDGTLGPFIELAVSVYSIHPPEPPPVDLHGEQLRQHFEILEAEGVASLLRASRVTVTQGHVVEFVIDRPERVAAEDYPSVTAALAPTLLDDGSIQMDVEVTATREAGTVRGPRGEELPITISEVLRTEPVVPDAGTAVVLVPVTLSLTPTGEPTEPGALQLALLMSPSVIGEVAGPLQPPAGNGAEVQVSVKFVKFTEGESLDTSALSAGTISAAAWLGSAVGTGRATVVNEPRIAIASGAAGTVSLFTSDVTDPLRHLESRFTFAPSVLADGRIRLVAEVLAEDQGARVIRHGSEPLPLSWKASIGFDVTVTDGETFLVDFDRRIAGAEPGDIWLITARIIE